MRTELTIIALGLLFLSTAVMAQTNECDNEVDSGTNCTVTSNVLTSTVCSSFVYNLSNSTTVIDDSNSLTAHVQAGLYELTFNQSVEERYTITLCDQSTFTINVRETSRTKLDNIIVNQSTIIDEIQLSIGVTRGLINISTSDVWTHTNRNLTLFDWAIVTSLANFQNEVSAGAWNNTFTPQSGRLVNVTGGGSITASTNNTAIALEVFDVVFANRTEIFYNDSSFFPVNETWQFDDGVILYRIFNYWPDNLTIRNATNILDTSGR